MQHPFRFCLSHLQFGAVHHLHVHYVLLQVGKSLAVCAVKGLAGYQKPSGLPTCSPKHLNVLIAVSEWDRWFPPCSEPVYSTATVILMIVEEGRREGGCYANAVCHIRAQSQLANL